MACVQLTGVHNEECLIAAYMSGAAVKKHMLRAEDVPLKTIVSLFGEK